MIYSVNTHYISCIWVWLWRAPHPKGPPTIFRYWLASKSFWAKDQGVRQLQQLHNALHGKDLQSLRRLVEKWGHLQHHHWWWCRRRRQDDSDNNSVLMVINDRTVQKMIDFWDDNDNSTITRPIITLTLCSPPWVYLHTSPPQLNP